MVVTPLEEIKLQVQKARNRYPEWMPVEFYQIRQDLTYLVADMSRMYENPNREVLTLEQQAWLARMLEIASTWAILLSEEEQLSHRDADKMIGIVSPKVAAMFEELGKSA